MRRNGLVLLTFGLPLALYLPIATGLAPTDTTQVVPSPEPSAKTRGTDPLFLQLSELQARLATLRAQYTDAHPDVIDVRQQIADLKAQLENKSGTAPTYANCMPVDHLAAAPCAGQARTS